MARVRIRYYAVRRGRGFWQPTAAMRAAGFRPKACGVDGPAAWAEAERMNAAWDAHRGAAGTLAGPRPGSLADVWQRYRALNVWAAKKPRTREEWEDVWQVLAPVFGDMPVAEIDGELVDAFYTRMEALAWSLHKRHRIIKIFRALLEVARTGFGLITVNPTHILQNRAPRGRSAIWSEAEAAALADGAWARGYHGLAVAILVAYDTQLQPVDVRGLCLAQRRNDGVGAYFDTARAKTGKRALATLRPATEALLDRYIAGLGYTLTPEAPILRNRSGAPYSKDTLADDFRAVRNALMPGDTRRLMDMRRTGNVEAAVGGAGAPTLSAKSGNTIGQSNALHETYTPVQLAAVRQADRARETGRKRLKGGNGSGI